MQVAFLSNTGGVCGQSIQALSTACLSSSIAINLWIKEDNDVSIDVMTQHMTKIRSQARSMSTKSVRMSSMCVMY
jgi:hypothetical protein